MAMQVKLFLCSWCLISEDLRVKLKKQGNLNHSKMKLFPWIVAGMFLMSATVTASAAQLLVTGSAQAQEHAEAVAKLLETHGVEQVIVKFEGFFCLTKLHGGLKFYNRMHKDRNATTELIRRIRQEAMQLSGSKGCVVYAYVGRRKIIEGVVGSFLDRTKTIVYFVDPVKLTQEPLVIRESG